MSKDCGHHDSCHRRKQIRCFAIWLGSAVVVILLIIFIVWLVLRPTKPRFYLKDATVQQFNLSGGGANILNIVLQVTIASHNPNDRVGIYYDRLDAYATYQSQQMTLYSALPAGYQGHGDVDIWSPYLYGPNVPVAPYVCASLAQDEAAGILMLYVRLDGRLRWKVGSWTSGGYHIYVSCPAVLSLDGRGVSPSFRFQQMSTCTVDV